MDNYCLNGDRKIIAFVVLFFVIFFFNVFEAKSPNQKNEGGVESYDLIEQLTLEYASLDYEKEFPEHLQFCPSNLTIYENKTIFLHGDSTMKLLSNTFIHGLFNHSNKCFYPVRSKNHFSQNHNITYSWTMGRYGTRNYVKPQLVSPKNVDVFIWNQGMHLLHLYPAREFENLNFTKHFKKYMHNAMKTNASCIIFKTSNPIVTSKFYGPYKIYSNLYEKNDNETIQNCTKIKNHDEYYCKNAAFTDFGVQWINRQIRKFVKKNKNVFLLDSYELFVNRENYTKFGDGRHFGQLKIVEAALLTQIITNFCEF